MFRYEIKKVFARTGGKVALALLLATLVIGCRLAAGDYYVNENGDYEYGVAAVRKLRAAQKAWSGILDEEKLRLAIGEITAIAATPQGQSKDAKESNIAFSWGQATYELRLLLNDSFADDFQTNDYYRAQSLTPDDAKDFYANRVRLLKEWLADEHGGAYYRFSDAEKDYLIRQYETLATPFYYDYTGGWLRLFDWYPWIAMITVMVLGYLVSGIFAGEYQLRTDAVFFAARYGRDKAVAAKVRAGFAIATGIYWAMVLLYSAFVLAYYGADGISCPVQATRYGWKCFYHITIGQEYALEVFGGYVGCLFISGLVMFLSARGRSAVVAVLVPFVIIFLRSFLGQADSKLVSEIMGLWPDLLLQMHETLAYFNLYEPGGKVVGAVPIQFALYSVLTGILAPLIYRVYRRS